MFFNYNECLEKYKTDYFLSKAVNDGRIFKVEKGIYSDLPFWTEIALVAYKNANAVFTMDSAFYYQNMTDVVPENYSIGTKRNATKISDKNIKQYFYPNEIFMVGVEEKNVLGSKIKIYTKERMLIELIRHRNKIPFDYYKEIISNYRNNSDDLDIQWLEENVSKFPASKKIMDSIQLEVF